MNVSLAPREFFLWRQSSNGKTHSDILAQIQPFSNLQSSQTNHLLAVEQPQGFLPVIEKKKPRMNWDHSCDSWKFLHLLVNLIPQTAPSMSFCDDDGVRWLPLFRVIFFIFPILIYRVLPFFHTVVINWHCFSIIVSLVSLR